MPEHVFHSVPMFPEHTITVLDTNNSVRFFNRIIRAELTGKVRKINSLMMTAPTKVPAETRQFSTAGHKESSAAGEINYSIQK